MTSASDGLFPHREPGGDAFYYMLAIAFGAAAAWLDIKVGDLLLTAMIVVASCMLLGFLSPRKPLRWVLLIGICIPAAEWLAYFFLSEKPTRAQIYESFLAFLPGIAGAIGGAMARGVIDNLFAENKK
jgi:hypothetical protein